MSFASIEEVYGNDFVTASTCRRPNLLGNSNEAQARGTWNLANSGPQHVPLHHPGGFDRTVRIPGTQAYSPQTIPEPSSSSVEGFYAAAPSDEDRYASSIPGVSVCDQFQQHLRYCPNCRSRVRVDPPREMRGRRGAGGRGGMDMVVPSDLWWFWTFLVVVLLVITGIEVFRWFFTNGMHSLPISPVSSIGTSFYGRT